VSLIVARPLTLLSCTQVNVALVSKYSDPGIRIYTGSVIIPFIKNTSSTAVTLTGHVVVAER
jgi:hypothetical protein